jgi:hypothetical protein
MPAQPEPETISWEEAINRLLAAHDGNRDEAAEQLHRAVVDRLIGHRPPTSVPLQGRLDCKTGELRMHAHDNHPRRLRVVLPDFERYFQLVTAGDNAAVGRYMPAYLALIHQAIRELQISDDNQPKLDTLSGWFRNQVVNGKNVSERLAKAMATIVRRPERMAGGAHSQKRKG